VGTKGQSRRVEGFSINQPSIPGVELEYMAHVEGSGDSGWYRNGQFVGTRGQARRIEGFAVRVIGYAAGYYDVKYYAHVANVGDTPVQSNGAFVGSRGQSRRVEGLAIWLESRGVPAPVAYVPVAVPSYNPAPAYAPAPAYVPVPAPTYAPVYAQPTFAPAYPVQVPQLQVVACVQGHQSFTAYGQQLAGTRGQSRRLEAFTIHGADLEYMAHIANKGDTHWHRNGQQVGHQGGERIEGFAVRLVGHAASQFDVKYFGHVEGSGDSPVGSNGAFVGTKGQSKRLEGLAVWLEPRRF